MPFAVAKHILDSLKPFHVKLVNAISGNQYVYFQFTQSKLKTKKVADRFYSNNTITCVHINFFEIINYLAHR